ncbi:hypothetical protein [Microbacterium sp. LWS13-1.2]|uniref:Uncharacterized protein n=1 Tax=Microbacterium sp. LWS13-1.2 TaxID=3135264 RepID=A0AAU6SAL9_9MICO
MSDQVSVSVTVDQTSSLYASDAVRWAIAQVERAQSGGGKSIALRVTSTDDMALGETAARVHGVSEAFAVITGPDGRVIAGDERGVVYALLEIEDTLRTGGDVMHALRERVEEPTNAVRGIMRLFTSEPEDSPWFRKREFWVEYLDELARHRINRFTFTAGAGYDYLIDRQVDDTYFCFFYPYVLKLPGYDVSVDGLPAAEREENMDLLKFIARETVRRGISFRLGLWNHAYDYGTDRADERHRILGLGSETHAIYCRDALVELLRQVPEISGITFRVHFEGGVPEPTHEFWATVLERLSEVDTLHELDFHAKGVDENLIATVDALGKKLVLSPKYWAEHMGPPYHQASIRTREAAPPALVDDQGRPRFVGSPNTGHHDPTVTGTSVTSRRSFTRYGYGDFLRSDRTYDLIYRVWPGTQRVLMWGDPAMAAGIGREASFGGALGVEWFEPMSFKGKKGSGSTGGREVYEDADLALGIDDWRKFSYTYRLWGRLTYDPMTEPDVWKRALRQDFGDAADEAEQALASATRILPYLLLTHAPSVANNVYWPEMITPVPIIRDAAPTANPYAESGWPANSDFDMNPPHHFGNVSSLDPQLFATVDEFVSAITLGGAIAKVTPLDSADRFERLARAALAHLAAASQLIPDEDDPTWRRWKADVRIMAGIGLFTASKLRAATAFALSSRGTPVAGFDAVEHYDSAIRAWKDLSDVASVYRSDLTFGQTDYSRGHWRDRLPAIIADRDAVSSALSHSTGASGLSPTLADLTRSPAPPATIDAPEQVKRGDEIAVVVTARGTNAVNLWVRRTDQSQPWLSLPTTREGHCFSATIDNSMTDTPFDLQIIVELVGETDRWLVPGFDDELSGRPYIVVSVRPR